MELFKNIRQTKDATKQAAEFGKLADTKDSKAVKISNFSKTPTLDSHQALIDFDE